MTAVPQQAADLDQVSGVRVTGPGAVRGRLRVPGDKSISHRALLLSGLARGRSRVTGLSGGDDVVRTRAAMRAFGVGVTDDGDGLVVDGGLRVEPDEPLDLGNSGTATRLIAGVCAGLDMFTVITGDRYLRARPMDRVAVPLRQMGARIDGRHGGSLAPLAVRGGALHGITYPSPVASAQVKSAILLAGLTADGPTTVVEPAATRRHTEEMFEQFGIDVVVDGTSVTVRPGVPTATDVHVPGDPSQAAFWAVAALTTPDSDVTVEDLYLGPGRTGFIDVLLRMGGELETDPASGSLRARTSALHGADVGAEDIPGLVDEVPVLAVAAARAKGTTVISGAGELRVKESDRIRSTVAMLRAFGARAEETADGLVVEGGAPLHAAEVDAHGDHRIAMAAAVCAAAVDGVTTIRGWDSVATSYPGFARHLRELTGRPVAAAD